MPTINHSRSHEISFFTDDESVDGVCRCQSSNLARLLHEIPVSQYLIGSLPSGSRRSNDRYAIDKPTAVPIDKLLTNTLQSDCRSAFLEAPRRHAERPALLPVKHFCLNQAVQRDT